MVSIFRSPVVRDFLSMVFKTNDPSEKIGEINKYLVKNFHIENQNKYRTNIKGRLTELTSNYFVRNNEIFVNDSNFLEILKLPVIYMYRIRPELTKNSAYLPENIFASYNYEFYKNSFSPHYDKDLNSFLSSNKEIGCLYTERDIQEHYPSVHGVRLLTLYRVCNSLGRYVDLNELDNGNIKGFSIDPDSKAKIIGEGLSSNPLFNSCVEIFRSYLELSATKAGNAKVEANKKIFTTYLNCMSLGESYERIRKNPLVIAKFIKLYEEFTKESRGFKDDFEAIKLLTPRFKVFLKKVFGVNSSLNDDILFIEMPKSSVVDLLSEPVSVGEYLRSKDAISVVSTSNTLSEKADLLATHIILRFLQDKLPAPEDILIDAFLMILGRTTTNSKRFGKPVLVTLKYENMSKEIDISVVVNALNNKVSGAHNEYLGMNVLRLWANSRSSRAMRLFRSLNFNPGLFSYCPGILDYMRFDFYKAIPLKDMTDEEVQSFRTLRLHTEKRTDPQGSYSAECDNWILNLKNRS
uniref:p60 n=1 Tax=Potato yellow vein virus TaxID=103881 RepID=A0A8A8QVU5_9CLOS|nr:p60 [Potato yellow vein virus]